MTTEINYATQFGEELERAAEWRRDVAERNPEDAQRNLDAARCFDRMASEIDSNDDVFQRCMELVYGDEIDGTIVSETTSALNHEVGFGFEPTNLDAYLRELVSRLEAQL